MHQKRGCFVFHESIENNFEYVAHEFIYIDNVDFDERSSLQNTLVDVLKNSETGVCAYCVLNNFTRERECCSCREC